MTRALLHSSADFGRLDELLSRFVVPELRRLFVSAWSWSSGVLRKLDRLSIGVVEGSGSGRLVLRVKVVTSLGHLESGRILTRSWHLLRGVVGHSKSSVLGLIEGAH